MGGGGKHCLQALGVFLGEEVNLCNICTFSFVSSLIRQGPTPNICKLSSHQDFAFHVSNFDHIGGVVKGPHIVEALYLKGMGGGSHKCFKVLSLQHALISMSSFIEGLKQRSMLHHDIQLGPRNLTIMCTRVQPHHLVKRISYLTSQ